MNDPSASEQDGFGAIPRAKRVPKERVFHGDTFIDQYEWLRDKQSQDVQDYVAAQNRYCEQRMAPLASLRKTLFEEFKSHVQETDMVRADAHGRLLVLHPHHAGGGNTPRNAACRSAARTIGIRRQWRPACHSTANRWCSIRTPRRKATISSASAAWTFPRTAVGCCTAPTRLATNATISASVILRPATSWRSGSKASAEPASRRTRNGCSMCCWTTRGVHTR